MDVELSGGTVRWKKGQAPRMDTGMVSGCAHPQPGVLMAGGSETGPWCQVLVQSQPWSSSQDHTPAKQTLHQLSVKWIFMCIRRKEAEVFAQATVSYLNCSQAKA